MLHPLPHPMPQSRGRATKIIATLGPSSQDRRNIYALLEAGVDVFRLNFSHGSHDAHRKTIYLIREIEAAIGRPITLLADLQGPKLRIGQVDKGTMIKQGELFDLVLDEIIGNGKQATLPHAEIYRTVKPGSRLLLDDGRLSLRVTETSDRKISTTIEVGVVLSSCKGVNVPDVTLPIGSMTAKDRLDLTFALSQGIKIFALSFVQVVEDVHELRTLAKEPISIVSKLEKPSALDHLAGIVEASDAVMVARGDLGVELSPDQVPIAQRKIVATCRQLGKPVIVATQMLESMISAPTPTRAEASDVANAVYARVDAVMLSAETAAGSYPIEAVSVMGDIIERVESDVFEHGIPTVNSNLEPKGKQVPFAMSKAVKELCKSLDCETIATFTTSGSTAVSMARERPEAHILGLTANTDTARFLSLVWGVQSIATPDASNFSDMVTIVRETLLEDKPDKKGELVIVTAGVPFGTPGGTNLIHVENL
ncbi:pyruvate kinase [Kiloniella sp.]|uniref:pyruvate kinase n=1 Tax=Kiloniella sp. TaxID=1938587 RepID=UPI003B02EA01